MYNLFKFNSRTGAATFLQETPKSTAEIVAEIHETFFTEVDRLKQLASEITSTHSPIQEKLNISSELFSLGFQQCKQVKEAIPEHHRVGRIEEENKNKLVLQRAINHFSFHYPNYKFITENSVIKICEKYGLIYGSSYRFIGSVPLRNMEEIKKLSVRPEDEAILIYTDGCANYDLYEKFRQAGREFQYMDDSRGLYGTVSEFNEFVDEHKAKKEKKHIHEPYMQPANFEIAAPASDFDKQWAKVQGAKLVESYPDPVVLKPVIFEGKKHYLIVTAWGPEASDELVVNQKMN